jgi:hypothetical protein
MVETIREFGREQLAATGELEALARRHAEHYLALAVAAEPHLTGPGQAEWLDRCDQEHANLRAALRWAIAAGETDRAQEAAGAIWRFWQQRGHLTEGRRWLEEVLAMPSGQGRTPARAKALTGAGGIAWWQEDIAAAGGFYPGGPGHRAGAGRPRPHRRGALQPGVRGGRRRRLRRRHRAVRGEPGAGAAGGGRAGGGPCRMDGRDPRHGRGPLGSLARRCRAGRGHLAADRGPPPAGRRPGLAGRRLRPPWPPGRRPLRHRRGPGLVPRGGQPHGHRLGHPRPGLPGQVGGPPPGRRPAGRSRRVPPRAGRRPAALDFLAGFLGDPEAEARARLPADAAQQAWEEGRRLGVEEALEG